MTADRPDGMLKSELELIKKIIKEYGSSSVLEIGLANASSSIAILEAIDSASQAKLTSVDPYQNYKLIPDSQGIKGYAGIGLANIKAAGFAEQHIFIESPSYLALPKLVEQQQAYDLILIDGYHSFDFTFIDFFYADLLLKDGGVLLIHDSNMKSVYSVCRFILCNKNYSKIGPEIMENAENLCAKIWRRLRYLLSGRYSEFKLRQTEWKSLAAFKKNAYLLCPEKTLKGISFY